MIIVVFCNYNTILYIFNPNLNLEMANMYQLRHEGQAPVSREGRSVGEFWLMAYSGRSGRHSCLSFSYTLIVL